jgi:hypothetical protein
VLAGHDANFVLAVRAFDFVLPAVQRINGFLPDSIHDRICIKFDFIWQM